MGFVDKLDSDAVDAKIKEHSDITTGIHGVGSLYVAAFKSSGERASKIVAVSGLVYALQDTNRTSDSGYTDCDISAEVSANARFAIIGIQIRPDTVGSGSAVLIYLRANGETTTVRVKLDKTNATAGDWYGQTVIVGLDGSQVFEYNIDVTTGWQIDTYLRVLGYIE